jgi:hypothetical protein
MLQYTQQVAHEKEQSNPKARKLSGLFEAADDNCAEGDITHILAITESSLKDAKVKFKRADSRGSGYNIAEKAVHHYLHWDDMPWER